MRSDARKRFALPNPPPNPDYQRGKEAAYAEMVPLLGAILAAVGGRVAINDDSLLDTDREVWRQTDHLNFRTIFGVD